MTDLESHFFADDGQIYSSCLPPDADKLLIHAIECVSNTWTALNCLMLNPTKTELLRLSKPRRKHLISCASFALNGVDIVPTKSTSTLLHGSLIDERLGL